MYFIEHVCRCIYKINSQTGNGSKVIQIYHFDRYYQIVLCHNCTISGLPIEELFRIITFTVNKTISTWDKPEGIWSPTKVTCGQWNKPWRSDWPETLQLPTNQGGQPLPVAGKLCDNTFPSARVRVPTSPQLLL